MLVIADFDNYFYAVRNPDSINLIISDEYYSGILTWETTTSYDSQAQVPENELQNEMVLMMSEMCMRPKYIHLKFGDRTCKNKTLFIIYKVFQTLYTAFYYYFMPFIATLVIFAFLIN